MEGRPGDRESPVEPRLVTLMDPIFYPWLQQYSSSWGVWLALIALKGLLILALLEGVVALQGRAFSASARHTFRMLGLLALLLLSLLSLGLPQWSLSLMERPVLTEDGALREAGETPKTVAKRAEKSEGLPESGAPVGHAMGLSPGHLNNSPVTPSVRRPGLAGNRGGISGENLIAIAAGGFGIVWILGSLILMVRLLLGMASVWSVILRSKKVSDPHLKWVASVTATRLNLGRAARLYLTPRLEVALSVGVIRPAVLLPAVWRTWSEDRLRSILLHEFAHVKRLDNLSNLISELACICFWINPLVWRTARNLRVDRERACDDQVLEAGTRPSDYAGHLLEVARAVSSRRLWGSLEVSQSSVLKDRFQALLNPGVKRGVLSDSAAVKAFFLAFFVLLPISTVVPWSAPGTSGGDVSLSSGLDGPIHRSALLRRGSESDHPLRSIVNPTSLQLPSRSRASILKTQTGPVSGDPGDTLASRFSSGRLIRPDRGRAMTRVVSTRNAVSRAENARRMERFSEVFQSGTAPGASSPVPTSRRDTSIVPIPASRVGLNEGETEASGSQRGGVPASEREIEVVEVVSFDLGTLGSESAAADINDKGVVVGQSRTGGGVVHPFLWDRQVGMVDLGEDQQAHTRAVQVNSANQVLCETFDSYVFRAYVWSLDDGLESVGALDSASPLTVPQAMNERGHVVGSSRGARGVLKAFVWSPETGIVDIEAPGWSEALAINEIAQVVGYSDNRAFVWSRDDGLRYIGPEAALFSTATSINRFGEIVGWARYQEDQPRAFYWSPERGFIDLGGLDLGFPLSMAYEIGDHGVVVGHSLSLGGAQQEQEVRAFRWTLSTGMESLGRAPTDSRIALNALGQIVGTNLQASEVNNPLAFLWTEEGRVTLQATPDPANLPSEGVAINNHGQIAGNTLLSNDLTRAYLWEVRFVPSRTRSD